MASFVGFKMKGCSLAWRAFSSTLGAEECRKIIAEQTEGMNREELAEYATDLLFGIVFIKQRILDAHLFGGKSSHV